MNNSIYVFFPKDWTFAQIWMWFCDHSEMEALEPNIGVGPGWLI